MLVTRWHGCAVPLFGALGVVAVGLLAGCGARTGLYEDRITRDGGKAPKDAEAEAAPECLIQSDCPETGGQVLPDHLRSPPTSVRGTPRD